MSVGTKFAARGLGAAGRGSRGGGGGEAPRKLMRCFVFVMLKLL